MARAKTDKFDSESVRLADFAKALAHPARLAILRILAAECNCICGQIVIGLPLAQSTVSQHLQELQKAGLIDGETRGTKSCYCINYEKLQEYIELLGAFHLSLQNKGTGR